MLVEEYRDSDAPLVAALLSALPEHPSTNAQDFRAFAAQSYNCGAKDFRVIRSQERIVALLCSTILPESQPPLRHFRILVHPDHRRAGLGSILMAELRAQNMPPGAVYQSNSQESWSAGNAFLESFEFVLCERELLMRQSRPKQTLALPDLAELRIRHATADDDPTWSRLHQLAYQELDDFSALSADDLASERATTGFALLVAETSNRIAGYCHVLHLDSSEGLINSLVVRSEDQGRGIGRALLAHGMHHLWLDKVECVSLNVLASKLAAVHLYEEAGFACYDQLWRYQRTSPP